MIYNVFYYPREGRQGDEEPLGKFETTEEAGDVIAEDVARRTALDLDVVEKVQAAFGQYQVFPSDESKEDIEAKMDRALHYAAEKCRLTESG